MSDKRIKISTSIPSLKDKIKIDLPDDNLGVVYWYIRFNIPLDPNSVSDKTMEVTDTEGYIMRTEISYDTKMNRIVISPLDTYEQNLFYLLTISKKVRSAKGQKLRSKIHIMFKLIGNQISEYRVLKSTVQVPKPRPRPRNYDQNHVNRVSKTKVYTFEEPAERSDILPYGKIDINLIFALIGFIIMISSFFWGNTIFSIFSMAIALLGALHILYQLTRKQQRSQIAYNQGVFLFNRTQYESSRRQFLKSSHLDPLNELAEFALNKVSFYL